MSACAGRLVMMRTIAMPSANFFSMSRPRKLPSVKPRAKAMAQLALSRFCMTLVIAKSQVSTSKNPNTGASTLFPRETKMVRSVLRVTTHISARKITRGSNDTINFSVSGTIALSNVLGTLTLSKNMTIAGQ